MIREKLPTIRYYSRKKKYIILKEVIKISTYIHFTKEQREQSRRTDLANFLISHGEKVRKSGGDAVDFVRRFYNKDYAEAVKMLLNNCGGQIITSPPIEKERKPFELPPRNDRMNRLCQAL